MLPGTKELGEFSFCSLGGHSKGTICPSHLYTVARVRLQAEEDVFPCWSDCLRRRTLVSQRDSLESTHDDSLAELKVPSLPILRLEEGYAYFQGKIVPLHDAKVSIATHALQYGTTC